MKLYIVEIDPGSDEIFQKLEAEGSVPRNAMLVTGSAFSVPAEALVSPANSRGIMRGGFDGFIATKIRGIENQVKASILHSTGRNVLPVGQTLTIDINSPIFKKLIVAPTMANPGMPCELNTVYMVSKAIFKNNKHLGSITMTPLGTGVGGLDLEESVAETLRAYQEMFPF